MREILLPDVGDLPRRPSIGLNPADLSPTSVSSARARFTKGCKNCESRLFGVDAIANVHLKGEDHPNACAAPSAHDDWPGESPLSARSCLFFHISCLSTRFSQRLPADMSHTRPCNFHRPHKCIKVSLGRGRNPLTEEAKHIASVVDVMCFVPSVTGFCPPVTGFRPRFDGDFARQGCM